MAKKIKSVHTKIKNNKIYILIFPPSKEFFINETTQEKMDTVFKDHINSRNSETKDHIEKLLSTDLIPQMYLLERYEGTKTYCYSRKVAWAKLLIENGYICVNNKTFLSYTRDLIERSQEFYDEIKSTDLSDLLSPNKSLFPDYKKRKKQDGANGEPWVHIRFSQEDYEKLKRLAKEEKKSLSTFCASRVLNCEYVALDYGISDKYMMELREGISTMQQSILTIHKLGQYFPSDLSKIEDFVKTVQDHYKKFNRQAARIEYKIGRINSSRNKETEQELEELEILNDSKDMAN